MIPVWHCVSASDVAAYSPLAADKLAADTRGGLDHVAKEVIAVLDDDPFSPSRNSPNMRRRFLNILEVGNKQKIADFLELHPKPAEPEPKRRQAFEQQPASAVPGSFG